MDIIFANSSAIGYETKTKKWNLLNILSSLFQNKESRTPLILKSTYIYIFSMQYIWHCNDVSQ